MTIKGKDGRVYRAEHNNQKQSLDDSQIGAHSHPLYD
jgi:hypothetical protein